jgi:glycosyltransferase involved in cell wall biosynthesis
VVTVVLPGYNDVDRLRTCLQALAEQTYPRELLEILVVDNASSDPIEEVAGAFEGVRVVRETRCGSYAARNRGVIEARGSVLAFTDSDCIPLADWVENGVAHLLRAPDCGMAAGRVDLFVQDPERPRASELYDRLFYLDQEKAISRGHYGATANLFTFRHVLDDVGLFNPELRSSGDAEWGNRVHARGLAQIYAPDAVVRHPARESVGQLYRKTVRITGGLHDTRSARNPHRSRWRVFTDEVRMWSPPVRKVAGVLAGRTAAWIGSPGTRVKVAGLVIFLHYCRRLEFLRLALGGRSKNC